MKSVRQNARTPDLTCAGLGKMIKRTGFLWNGDVMFRPARKFLLCVLIAATALAGGVPATGACAAKGSICKSKTCCGVGCTKPSESVMSCCGLKTESLTCRCSARNEHPAASHERRASDVRSDLRNAEARPTMITLRCDGLNSSAGQEASLFSFLPNPRRQAVLCCWLI